MRSPFKRGDSWVCDRETLRIERRTGDDGTAECPWRPTYLMERVSRAIEADPGLSRRALRTAVKGKHEQKELALEMLISEGYVDPREEGAYVKHYSLTPFREDDDQPAPTGPQTGPRSTGDHHRPPGPHTQGPGPGTTPLKPVNAVLGRDGDDMHEEAA